MNSISPCDTIVLPPILMQSMQHALDKGTFFSSTSQFGHFLPCPQFPRSNQDISIFTPTDSQHASRIFPYGPRIFNQESEPCAHGWHRISNDGPLKDVHVRSSRKQMWPDQVSALDCPSPDSSAEWSTADGDYSSDPSSTSSLVAKKTRKIVLTSAQAKDVRTRPTSCRFSMNRS
jgi:hypothetical protein